MKIKSAFLPESLRKFSGDREGEKGRESKIEKRKGKVDEGETERERERERERGGGERVEKQK